MNNLEKIYSVEFMNYTDCLKDTVSDWDGESSSIKDIKYLNVGHNFLLKESQLELYRKFGGGYRNIKFVGELPICTKGSCVDG